MQEINLRHFFALADIADSGRLSVTAERVHISQSALTQALRKLERQFGTELFVRVGFGVSATSAGEMLIQRSRRAFALLARAEKKLRQRETDMAANISIGYKPTASQLRALIAIVETGGFSLAARKLSLTQPSVHRAAKQLEVLFGLRFFARTAKGVETSESAELLARYAALMFAEIRQGFEELNELQGRMSTRVAIGCLPLARAELLPQAVTELVRAYPEAGVSILDGPYSEQIHALRHGQTDWLIGALRDPPPTADLRQQHLFAEPLSIVVRTGHPMLRAATPTPSSLANLAWIAPTTGTPARDLFATFFENNGVVPPRRVIECSSLAATRGLLQLGDRAALLSPSQVRRDVDAGQLAILAPALPGTARSIGITTRADWVPTAMQAKFASIVHRLTRDRD